MRPVANRRIDYLSYLLRLWLDKGPDKAVWRASLEESGSGKRQGFKDLGSLFLYLNSRAAQLEKDTESGRDMEGESCHQEDI
jgi:hypothetical protein